MRLIKIFERFSRVRFCGGAFVICFSSVIPDVSLAGDIFVADDLTAEEMEIGCNFALRGQIEEGDAAAIAEIVETLPIPFRPEDTHGQRRLCLSSPGGNLLEAIGLARIILESNVSTAVPSGAFCESACAVSFMAGSYIPFGPAVRQPDRHMGANSRVGFHAPALRVSNVIYNQEHIENSYQMALGTVDGVLNLFGYGAPFYFPYHWFLQTPFEQMRYVETVGEAISLRINVYDLALPSVGGVEQLQTACENLVLADMYVFHGSESLEYGVGSHFREVISDERSFFQQPDNPWEMWNISTSQHDGVEPYQDSSQFSVALPLITSAGGYRGARYSTCEFSALTNPNRDEKTAHDNFRTPGVIGLASFNSDFPDVEREFTYLPLYVTHLYSPRTPLSELVRYDALPGGEYSWRDYILEGIRLAVSVVDLD